ncbi:restriction endonuclease [Hydrogenophaga sp. ZJX-1]|uniref:restriction endonuclease n=1 Tax=Hydrogenophaga sp. ZJX-1 TaxID=3404778 RepID=UPI003B28A34D
MQSQDHLVDARVNRYRQAFDAAKSMATLTQENLVEGLTEKLKDILQRDEVVGLAYRATIIGIDRDQLNALIEKNYNAEKKTLSISGFTQDFLECIRQHLREQDLLATTKSLLPDDLPQLILSAIGDTIKHCIDTQVLLCANFFYCFDEDCATIRAYKKILLAKKRQLSSIDKWGDVDMSPWFNVLREFSSEKLRIGAMEALISSTQSDEAREHFASIFPGGHIGSTLIYIVLSEGSDDEMEEEAEISTGRDYEISLSLKIQNAFPDAVVETTPASRDQGADIIVTTPKLKIAIQAKYYSTPVGNAAVQEVFASKSFYNASDCMVISPMGYTNAAKLLATKTNVFLANDDDYIELLRCLME